MGYVNLEDFYSYQLVDRAIGQVKSRDLSDEEIEKLRRAAVELLAVLDVEYPGKPQRLVAPWTPEQVHALNDFQCNPMFHPFTCLNQGSADHYQGEHAVLVATKNGWICTYCGYTQNWAHPFMAEKHGDMLSILTSLKEKKIE
jgi:hypothetical protein